MKGRRRKSTTTPKKESTEQEQTSIAIAQREITTPTEAVQNLLRERLCQFSVPPEIYGYEQERKQLLELIRRTATTGESNSALLIGPRGSGKTMLLNDVLKELMAVKEICENLLQVHLNGLLQTDDKIALKEITRQLQLENTIGDKVFGSFSETLQFLLDALKSGSHGSKPILFVLDEFDLFAHHKNQTLLYNLFDVAQSAMAPVCVIGVTCRLDVIELLEKRVKSRFSHRQIYLFNTLTFDDYCKICHLSLSLPDDFPDKFYSKEWNKNIQEFCEDLTVVDVLRQQFNFNKDIQALHQLLIYPVSRLGETHPHMSPSDFVDGKKLLSTDTKSAMLHGISILELCLIIAMKHLTDIYDGEPFNFEMVYSEYSKFAQRRSSMQVYEKAVVLKAFEHLLALELVRSVDGSGTRIQKEYRLMSLLIHPSQIMDALQKYPNCPTEVKQWAQFAVAY